jgi:radical SAM superfamily enzyme with C-terminal helix-hairpin-helix motif
VVDHRERSLIALPCPIDINSLPQKALELIPGIGKKRASEIILKRPFRNEADALALLDGVSREVVDKIRVRDGSPAVDAGPVS